MRECDNCGRISEDSRFLKPQQHVPQCFLIIESKYLQESPASQLFAVSTPVKSCDVSFYNEETSQKVTFDLPKIIGGANHNSTNRRDVSSTSSQLHLRPLPNERLNLFLPSRELYMRERALQQIESAALNERVIADTRKDIALIRDMLRSAITARPLKEKQHDRPNHDETLPPAKVRKAETGKWEKELFDGFGEAADADAVDQLLNSGEATRNRDREEVCVIEFNRMVKTSSLCVGKYGLNIKGIEDMDITAPATEFTVCVEEYKVVSSQGPRVLHEVRHRLYRSINMKREHNKSFDASFGQPVEFFVTECNDLHVFIIHLLYRGRLFAWSSVNALYEGPWVSKLRKPPVDMAVALVVEHINLDDPILRGFISDKASDDLGEAEAYLNRLESQPPATNKTVENMNDPSVSAVNLRPRMSAKTGVDKASETIQHTKTQRQNYDENGKVVLAASPVPPVTKKSFSHKEERETTSPSGPQNSTAILKPYPREYREERETTSPSDPQNSTAILKPYPREYKEERETTSPSGPQNSTAILKPYPREYREERETTSPSGPQNSTAILKPYPREYREERETTSPSDPQNSTAILKPYPREYKEERETTSPSGPQNSTAILKPYPREYKEERETTSPSGPQNSTAILKPYPREYKEERETTSPSGPQNSTAILKPYPREYKEERETTSPSGPQNSTAILKPYPREYREERETTSPSGPQNSTAILKPYPREYREERETTSPSGPQNSTAILKPYPREYKEERETTSPSDPQNSTAILKPYPREYREERETTSPSDPQNSTAILKPYPREYREERETTSPSGPQNSTAILKPYPREYKEERETTSPSDPQNSTATLKPYPREYREERETTSPSDPQNSAATLRRFRRGGMDGRDGRDHTGAVTCQSNGGCVSSKGESSDTKTNGASGTRNRGRNNDGNGDKITGGSGSQRFPVEERVSPLSACVLLGLRSEGDVPSSRKIGSEREGFASVDLRVNKIVGLPPNCLCARVLVYFVNYISRQTKGLVNDSSDCELFMRPPNAIGYQKSGGNGTSPTFDIKFDDIMVTNKTYAIVIIEYITNPKCGPTTFGHVSLPIHTLAPVGNFLSRIRLGDPREPEARSVHVDRLSGPTSILTSYRSSKQRQHAVAEGKFDAAALYDKLLQPLKSRAECHPCGFISWCVGSDPNAPSFEYPGEPPLSNGEVELFSVREALDTSKSFHYTDIGEPMRAFGQQRSQSFRDFSSIVPYDPNRGFFILTEAVHGMCTREALYVVVTSINVNGHNNIAYTKKFRWSSDVGAPHFDDPIKAIRMVKAHPFTVAEKYLLRITNLDTIPKYEGRQLLVEQVGWTLLKMFPEDGAVRTGRYALALFEGTPPPQLLDEVKSYPMDEVLSYWVLSNRVQYITPPASVVVSIGDICFAEQFSVDHPGRPQPQKLMTTKHQEISLPCVGNEGSMGYKQDDLLKDMGISVEKAESAIRTALKSFLHRTIQRRREKYGKKDVRFVDGE
ncbi:hypothetical protein, conserved [Trypanosoma brucei gambiense DAL972]|uniref:Uncharacterized protein n=1 Tax=Trypanosoma brucei gambiense (strain MHOM/CI/86/DAL972) TaxID=679716 RepID=C9ZRS0_TRYB9|nr:hypothetical protein, conserved [Trypanosoma brucei gambiense DAL972]CBH12056.1 hypothetical protein, conserved [Trypanosoma brucei gambiense DAL972]|eukprot:XP_011774339.1 hypothetical protein, conserved [Trypanosoma brucei gambiense DAL972]